MQNMSMDMSMLNQSFSEASEEMLASSGKKKAKAKDSKKEKKLKKQVDELEEKVISLQKQLRDTNSEVNHYKRKESKWQETEQEFMK